MLKRLLGDTRLLGRWKSDSERTSAELATRTDIPAANRLVLAGLFGNLELRYTRWHVCSTFHGVTERKRCRIAAWDASSVVVVYHDSIAGKTIQHVHFDKESYWIALGSGGVREFFRRIR